MARLHHPQDLKYSKEHEWLRMDGEIGVVGITSFAQDELGDIIFVELPAVGATVRAGQIFGSVESVKTVSDLYSPISGTVVDVNRELENEPELVNRAPYGQGWILKVQLSDPGEVKQLLSAAEYETEIHK